MATLNIGMKISGAATGGMVVPANSAVIATYAPNNDPTPPNESGATGANFTHSTSNEIRVYGPGQTVHASFSVVKKYYLASGSPVPSFNGSTKDLTFSWSFVGGVVIQNTQ